MSNSVESVTPGAPVAPNMANQDADQPPQPQSVDSSSDSNSSSDTESTTHTSQSNAKKSKSKSRNKTKGKSKSKSKAKSKSESTDISSSTGVSSEYDSHSGSDSGECDSSSSDDQSSVNPEANESFRTSNDTLTVASAALSQSFVSPNGVAVTKHVGNDIGNAIGSAPPAVNPAPPIVVMQPVVLPESTSPLVVTPAKSLQLEFKSPLPVPSASSSTIFNSTPVIAAAPVPVPSIEASTVAIAVAKALADPSFDQNAQNIVHQPVTVGFAGSASGALNLPSTSSKLNGNNPEVKKKRAKKTPDEIKEERYARKLRRLESALKRAEKGKIKPTKAKKRGGKQRKEAKIKGKRGKRRDDPGSSSSNSSDDSSSSSSPPPSEPDVSNRIPRIPPGRALQQLAMSRVKELGLDRDIENRAAELAESLRLIDHIELPVTMDMAYRHFHQVPGTGLPHLQKHIRSFADRYSKLVRSVVKFHLIQAQRLNNAKREALGPEPDNPFVDLWQFKNDFARAPNTSIQSYQPLPQPLPMASAMASAAASAPILPLYQPPVPVELRAKGNKTSRKSAAKSPKRRKAKKQSSRPAPSTPNVATKRPSTMPKGGKKKKKKRRESSSEVNFYLTFT